MNQNKGSNPFANLTLAGDPKVDSVVSKLQGHVDSQAISLPVAPTLKKVSVLKNTGRPKAKQIYFSPEVADALEHLKASERANISAVVDKAVRQYLGM